MQTSTGRLRALDLNDFRSGPVTLNTEGDLPPGNQSQWHRYPADGCWYTGNGGNTIHKIQLPATNPLTETWTVSTVQIGGATLASQGTQARQGAVHNTRFFYCGRSAVSPGSPAGRTRWPSLDPDGEFASATGLVE